MLKFFCYCSRLHGDAIGKETFWWSLLHFLLSLLMWEKPLTSPLFQSLQLLGSFFNSRSFWRLKCYVNITTAAWDKTLPPWERALHWKESKTDIHSRDSPLSVLLWAISFYEEEKRNKHFTMLKNMMVEFFTYWTST